MSEPSVPSPPAIRAGVLRMLAGLAACTWPAVAGAADAGWTAAPLAERNAPAGATRFHLLSPAETGVQFQNEYADPRMWGDRYQEFALGAIGTGVAVADYDGDGRPDLFVVSKTGQSRLFRNLGGWKFEDVTLRAGLGRPAAADGQVPVGPWTQGAAFADINNDGRPDLYVCRFDAPNLLYVNQGDGTFREEAAARGLAVVDASGMAAFCDYDRDGWLDVFVQTNLLDGSKAPNGQPNLLFHNRGDGTFENVTARAGIAGEALGHSATWWDYDDDGWPDLYVANDFATPDRLYRNNRDGTFTDVIQEVVPHLPYSAMGADSGDVNNDGRLDLLVADMAATSHEKDQRGMADSREIPREDDAAPAEQVPRSVLYLATGLGRVQEAAVLAGLHATDWTWSVRFEDFDNDGRLDLFVTNGMVREFHNVDLQRRLVQTDNPAERINVIKASPVLRERHLAFRNLGDLRFEEVGQAWGLDQVGVAFGAATADFDGDGDMDLVYTTYDAGLVLLRNDSQDGHRVVVALQGTAGNRFGVGATVRIETASGEQVRQLVLARGYLSTSEPMVHFGLGRDAEIRRMTVTWPSGRTQVVEHLPVDVRLTLVEPEAARATRQAAATVPAQFEEMGAALGFQPRVEETFATNASPLEPFRWDRSGPALAVGDLDGDGRADLVLGGTARQPARWWWRRERFELGGTLPASALDDGPLLLLDADGDGRLDLLRTKTGAEPAGADDAQPVLYRNDGGGFVPMEGVLPQLSLRVGAAGAADFNRDGRVDVFLGGRMEPGQYPTAPRSALWVNRGGRFEDVTEQLAPGLREVGLVTAALWSDVDGDGWEDLLVATEWGPVHCFHNEHGQGFVERTREWGFAAAGTGWWTAVASADFNEDGRPDFVVGNAGLNTPYGASAALFAGDFRGNGGRQLIEVEEEGGKLFPRRASRVLAREFPALRRRFPRNDDFARATIEQVFGPEAVRAATRYAATELRSGVFLSQSDGSYRFHPLPRVAQLAPAQGLVAGDFDGDGHADIYAVQNSYAPIPSTGRFAGGLSQLLAGDGRGDFAAVEPAKSGLVVPGDAKALAWVDLDDDGWPDFLVTRNGAEAQVWRNRGIAGRHSLRIDLKPGPGATAAGAKVEVRLADGSVRRCEAPAGGGYLSQSPAAVFVGWVDSSPPTEVRVTWSDGRQDVRKLPGNSVPAVVSVR